MSDSGSIQTSESLAALQEIAEQTRQMNLRIDALIDLQSKNAEVSQMALNRIKELTEVLVESREMSTDLSDVEDKLSELSDKLSEVKEAVENLPIGPIE